MKYAIIINILFCLSVLGCKRADITIVSDYEINNNANFSASRAEGLDSPQAFPDYGEQIGEALSIEEEETMILNKWQEI